jgi:hypothetical protein
MQIKKVLAFLGAAAVSSWALAEPAPISVSADGSTVVVQGNPMPVYRLAPGQAEAVRGAFKLEDGRTLKLTNWQNKVFMELGGTREQLLPVSGTEFVAPRSGARLALEQEAFAGKVTLTTVGR